MTTTFDQFKKSYNERRYTDAISEATKLLQNPETLPENQLIDTHFFKGHAHRILKQYDLAQSEFDWLCQNFPKKWHGEDGSINIARDQKNWQQMLELAHTHLTHFPQRWESYYWIGHAHRMLKQFTQADEWFVKLTEFAPKRQNGWEGYVNVAEDQKNWQEMQRRTQLFYDKFAQDKWHTRFWFGMCAKNLGQPEKAEQYFTELNEIRPDWHRGFEELMNIARDQKNWQLTIERAQILKQKFPNMWQAYWAVGHAYKELRQYDVARSEFEHMQQKFPDRHQGWEGAINVAQHQADWQRVIQLSDELHAKFPNFWAANGWFQGQAYKELRQYSDAAEQFIRLQLFDSNRHHGFEGFVNIAQHRSNQDEIVQAAKLFAERFPNMWQGYWWQGHAHKNLQQYDEAAEQFEILREKFPHQHFGYEGKIAIAQHRQRWQEMANAAREFYDRFPNMWQGYWYLGQAQKNLGELESATKQFMTLQMMFPYLHYGYEGMVNLAQFRDRPDEIIQAAKIFTERFPQIWQGYWWQGHAYKSQYDYDNAKAVFRQLIEKIPHTHHGYEGLVNCAEHENNWQEVLELADDFSRRFPKLWHSYWWRGQSYKNLGEYDKAREMFQLARENLPNDLHGILGLIDVANDQNDFQAALQLSKIAISEFPKREEFYRHKGLALARCRRFAEAEAWFTQLEAQFPHSPMPLLGLVEVYNPQRKHGKSITVLQKALLKFPNNEWIARSLIHALLMKSEVNDALEIFNLYITRKETLSNIMLLEDIHKDMFGNLYHVEFLHQLMQKFPYDIGIKIAYLNSTESYIEYHDVENPHNPQKNIRILEELHQQFPYNQWIKNLLITKYIEFNQKENALSLINSLPQNKTDVWSLRLFTWRAHQMGDTAKEWAIWEEIAQKDWGRIELLTDKGKDLIYRSNKKLDLQPTDLPVFSCQHNEILRLPDFLRYYRELGVTHFIFIDNNSDDGSFEYLLEQPDCYVFWTNTSYTEAGCGVAWINDLIEKYVYKGQWFAHIDADELLVYPHCETMRLPALFRYLEETGAEAFSSFMLDMYPPDLETQLSFQSGDNMLENASYFYNSYYTYGFTQCLYRNPRGGIFYRFGAPPGWFVKTGFVKYRKNFRFLSSTHQISPVPLADISAAYLHFKMLGDFQAKAEKELIRKEHWGGGRNYRQYAKMYENGITNEIKLSELDKSVKYENSQQLVDLGLIQTSDAWERFVAENQPSQL